MDLTDLLGPWLKKSPLEHDNKLPPESTSKSAISPARNVAIHVEHFRDKFKTKNQAVDFSKKLQKF